MPDLRVVRGGADPSAADTAKSLSETAIVPPDAGADAKPAAATHADAIEPGITLGNYLIVSKIGEGGMGEVYKAYDTTLDRTVALKVLSPQLFRNQEFLQRFRIEAQAQARLNGPNIVTLHSMFEISGSLVLVMEHVEGQTLAQRIHNTGRLSLGTSVWVFEQALIGVERAHRMGIVHRDLKPSNIFITGAHEIKLMDFGVAKILDNKELTLTGSMIGTLMYISPEQISGKDADFRSDIYTLGITLFEAVTGKLPFDRKTDYEYMDAHLHSPPPRPSSIQADIPKELEAVILKAIEKDPDKRYQSALEFRSALIKVGMQHVKAYRNLKTMRKDKDRAVLSHYSHGTPTQPRITRPDLHAAAKSAWHARLHLLRRAFSRRSRYVLAAIASLALVAGGALSLGYYLAKQPTEIAVAPEAKHIEAVPAVAPGPAEATPLAVQDVTIKAADSGDIDNNPPVTIDAPTEPVAVPVKSTKKPTSKSGKHNKNTTHRSEPAAASSPESAPNPAPDDKKYDALRKAWGG